MRLSIGAFTARSISRVPTSSPASLLSPSSFGLTSRRCLETRTSAENTTRLSTSNHYYGKKTNVPKVSIIETQSSLFRSRLSDVKRLIQEKKGNEAVKLTKEVAENYLASQDSVTPHQGQIVRGHRFLSEALMAFFRCGELALGLDVFQFALLHKFKPDTHLCTAILSACLTKETVPLAISFFEQMSRDGIPQDAVTYSALIKTLSRVGDHENAAKYFQKMKDAKLSPMARTYTSMINSCLADARASMAVKYFEEMKAQGMVPELPVYHALFKVFTSAKAKDLAETYLAEMKSAGIRLDDQIYNSMLGIYAATKDVASAEAMLSQMRANGIGLDRYAYSHLLHLYSSVCDEAKTLEYFEKLKAAGIAPNAYHYAYLMKLYLTLGKSDAVVATFDEFRASGMTPTHVHYSYLLNAMVDSDAMSITEVVNTMIKFGLRPNMTFIAQVLTSAMESGTSSTALQIIALMRRERLVSVELAPSLIKFLGKNGFSAEAVRCFEEIKADEETANAARTLKVYNSLLDALSHSAKDARLCTLYFQEMRNANIFPDQDTFESLIQSAAISHDFAALSSIVHEMRFFSLKPSALSYVNILTACASPDAVPFLEKLKSSGFIDEQIPLDSVIVTAPDVSNAYKSRRQFYNSLVESGVPGKAIVGLLLLDATQSPSLAAVLFPCLSCGAVPREALTEVLKSTSARLTHISDEVTQFLNS